MVEMAENWENSANREVFYHGWDRMGTDSSQKEAKETMERRKKLAGANARKSRDGWSWICTENVQVWRSGP